jgi:hypothetical protein
MRVVFCILSLFFGFFNTAFCSDKWIVVTTIQAPTPQLRSLAEIPGWRLVVVGDRKTPQDWHLENCDYLSPEKQLELGYDLAKILPWNSYSRKNIGYLYAIEHGAKIIYETDDDNEPIGELSPCPSDCILPGCVTSSNLANVYSYFGQPDVWPRGFPLEKIAGARDFQIGSPTSCLIGIEQGIVNGDPDVDAIFRLTQDKPINFISQPSFYLPEGVFCPFNTQNTFFHEKVFFALYVPVSVSMRVADIWRGYLAQRLIWQVGCKLVFSGPNAFQERNVHDLFKDFLLEQDLFLKGSNLVNCLSKWQCQSTNPNEVMLALYQDLTKKDFFDEREEELVEAWLKDLERIRKPI